MDVTQRFSNRVENYIKYRPGYPAAMIDHIIARARLRDGDSVADIGSGTGIFTALLLAHGLHVDVTLANPLQRLAENRSKIGSAELEALAPRLAIAIGLALDDEE